MTSLVALIVTLSERGPKPTDVKAGWVALLIVLALAGATVLLWLNMRKQLRKIDFEEEPDQPPAGADRNDTDQTDRGREAR